MDTQHGATPSEPCGTTDTKARRTSNTGLIGQCVCQRTPDRGLVSTITEGRLRVGGVNTLAVALVDGRNANGPPRVRMRPAQIVPRAREPIGLDGSMTVVVLVRVGLPIDDLGLALEPVVHVLRGLAHTLLYVLPGLIGGAFHFGEAVLQALHLGLELRP